VSPWNRMQGYSIKPRPGRQWMCGANYCRPSRGSLAVRMLSTQGLTPPGYALPPRRG